MEISDVFYQFKVYSHQVEKHSLIDQYLSMYSQQSEKSHLLYANTLEPHLISQLIRYTGLKKESVSGKSSTCRNPKGMRVETGGCSIYIAHSSFNRGLAGRTTIPYVGGCASTRVASARRGNRSPINLYIVLTSNIFHCDDEYRR